MQFSDLTILISISKTENLTVFGGVTNDFYVAAVGLTEHVITAYDLLSFTVQWSAPGSTPPQPPSGQDPVPPISPPSQDPVPPISPPSQNPVPPISPPSQNPVPPISPPSQNPVPPISPPSQNPVPPISPPSQNPVPPISPPSQNPVPPISPPSQPCECQQQQQPNNQMPYPYQQMPQQPNNQMPHSCQQEQQPYQNQQQQQPYQNQQQQQPNNRMPYPHQQQQQQQSYQNQQQQQPNNRMPYPYQQMPQQSIHNRIQPQQPNNQMPYPYQQQQQSNNQMPYPYQQQMPYPYQQQQQPNNQMPYQQQQPNNQMPYPYQQQQPNNQMPYPYQQQQQPNNQMPYPYQQQMPYPYQQQQQPNNQMPYQQQQPNNQMPYQQQQPNNQMPYPYQQQQPYHNQQQHNQGQSYFYPNGFQSFNAAQNLVEGSLVAHIIYGSPYLTFKYGNVVPMLNGSNSIMSVNGITDKSAPFTGSRFELVFNNGNSYIVYALDGDITFNWVDNMLTATQAYNGVIRVGAFKEQSQVEFLDQHLLPYAVGCSISTRFEGDTAYIDFDWITEGGDASQLVMLTLPHHRQSLSSEFQVLSEPAFKSLKGPMLPLIGNKWTLVEQLTTISWHAPNPIPDEYLADIQAAVRADAATEAPLNQDTYGFGKNAARYARLALIAEAVSDQDSLNSALDLLEKVMQPWVDGSHPNSFLYDTTWGGVVSVQGLNDSIYEYGQGWYNDQHFHYGYFLYASAVLAHYRPEWGNQYKEVITLLARDIANPSQSQDPYFTTTRFKDWYMGHSWASGLFEFGDAKNQESTSESINGYYGLYLWGLAINDTSMSNFGRLLLQTEIRSAQNYWQIRSDNEVYESPFRENTMVGIVWATKVDYFTWFGQNVEFIHCIQMMPFTPITEELFSKDYIQIEYPVLSQGLTRSDPVIEEAWKGFVYMAQSMIDRETAWSNAKTLTMYDNGNSQSNTLYFIATRQ